MATIHKNLASGKWQQLSLVEQLANIGSEVNRVIYWFNNNKMGNQKEAIWRSLELIDLTIADKRWESRLFELTRLREVFCDLFLGKHSYDISPEALQNYFLAFALAARK